MTEVENNTVHPRIRQTVQDSHRDLTPYYPDQNNAKLSLDKTPLGGMRRRRESFGANARVYPQPYRAATRYRREQT